jgi:integrase
VRHEPYTIQLHSNGEYWLARWYDADGVRRFKSLGAKVSMGRLAAAQTAQLLEKKVRQDAAGGIPSVADVAARTFEGRHDIKDNTKVLYRETLAHFRAFAAQHLKGDRTRFNEVTKSHATEFLDFMMEPKGVGREMGYSTAHSHLRRMRAIYGMVIDSLPDDSPIANPFARRRWSAPKVVQDWAEITIADLEALMDASPNDGWRRFFALARLAGLRRGEALRLRARDIDMKRRMIRVLPEENARGQRVEGTKQAERFTPIRPELAAVLAPFVKAAQPDDLVCPISPLNFERTMHGGGVRGKPTTGHGRYIGIVERAGLDPIKRLPHTLRKNCGTEWAEEGIPITDIAKWLGNSVAVAAASYIRTTPTTFARVTGLAKGLAKRPRVKRGKPRKTA